MIRIDGGEGEGGGQVLRTALALSLATGTAFRLENIRGRRQKPGLLRQHLTAVQAATAIGGARVDGDALGSSALTFVPSSIRPGDYSRHGATWRPAYRSVVTWPTSCCR